MSRPLIGFFALLTLLTPPALAAPDAGQMVDDLAALRFDRLGHPAIEWDAIAPVQAPAEQPHQLLVVLVAFPDRGFDRFAGEPDQGAKLADFYRDQLFDPTSKDAETLSGYYRAQSMGLYHVQGHVLPPLMLSKPRAAYGGPVRPEGGDWRADADAEGLVVEALAAAAKAHPDLDWSRFDRWDPHDMDGDGLRSEADGYLDHLVLVYAGEGQASCHGLYQLGRVFTPDATPKVLETLDPKARGCAERIWPHRFVLQQGEGDGPLVEGRANARGGVELRPGLWVRDYNMQSEYIDVSTFVHEFAHGLGLPDVYARVTTNSTGPWSVMSSTTDPLPQNLTAWSRIQLGWLRPKVIRPPAFGGRKVQSVYLRTLDDPVDAPKTARALQAAGVWRAAMVVLPPRTRTIELSPPKSGRTALYSGQGNEMNRVAELRVDLRSAKTSARLSFAGWWFIEAGWDFVYVETSVDGGRTWTRRRPIDPTVMPAKHGHDGSTTTPGFTGLSGDRDGDGRNESNRGCDPKARRAHGEDRMGTGTHPCSVPTWVKVAFELDDLVGQPARIRLRYYTDMAAVQPGMLVDDLKLKVDGATLIDDGFEGAPAPEWRLDGWISSPGRHDIQVPHYYLLEYRDPYAAGAERFDRGMGDRNALRVYRVPDDPPGQLRAIRVRPRPGVVAWYADGGYAWSENDPSDLGPGNGFLLAVDAWPAEIEIPGLESWRRGAGAESRYDVKSAAAQKALGPAWSEMVCFVRGADWRPAGHTCDRPYAGVESLQLDGHPLLYSYARANALLPGPERERFTAVGELLDRKQSRKKTTWRLRDRSLRTLHTLDSPFALEPFEGGVEHFVIVDGVLKKVGAAAHPAVTAFSDATPRRWQNRHLPFGGVTVPGEGFGFELTKPKATAPDPARVKVWFTFDR